MLTLIRTCTHTVDLLYEGAQKRTFQSSILLASIHCIFLVEILVLNRKLGPNLNT